MTDYRLFYEKDYLGAWNIEAGDLVLTISKCVQGELNQPGSNKKTRKPVVYFRETDKGLALNATNGKTIAGLYGTKVEDWPGKRIALFKSMTRSPSGGDDVECLRVRPKAPNASKESAAPRGAASPSGADQAVPADAAAYITPEQVSIIETLCQDNNIPLGKLKTIGRVESLAMIEAGRYDKLLEWIDAEVTRQAA